MPADVRWPILLPRSVKVSLDQRDRFYADCTGVRVLEIEVMFKTVLFPIDRSPETQEAAIVVAEIVKTYSSRLILLSVVETQSKADDEENLMSSESAVAQLLNTAKSSFAQQGITAEVVERDGLPAFTICDVADEQNANLIVMGSRGLGLTAEGASESVTQQVINLSPCPILVVP